MIVHLASFLASAGGSVDRNKYLRKIPGRPGYAVLCQKPVYNKKKKKEMARRAEVVAFKEAMAEAKAIYHDAAQRAIWADRHSQALKKAKKHNNGIGENGKPKVPERLWDYIKREVGRGSLPPAPS